MAIATSRQGSRGRDIVTSRTAEHASSCMGRSGPGKDLPDSPLVRAVVSATELACLSEAARRAVAALERVMLARTADRAMGGRPWPADRYRSMRAGGRVAPWSCHGATRARRVLVMAFRITGIVRACSGRLVFRQQSQRRQPAGEQRDDSDRHLADSDADAADQRAQGREQRDGKPPAAAPGGRAEPPDSQDHATAAIAPAMNR